jgi:AcrR family transcriptional regulator
VENERPFSYPAVKTRISRDAEGAVLPRPRETSDEEIVLATMRVMQRRSPLELTLADVAKEAGVVPATLIQRFKTKRGLLLAVCRTGPTGVADQFAAAREKYSFALTALIELYVECSGFAATPEAMANGLAYLQIDLTDPDFHAITLKQFTAIRDATKELLDAALAAGELKPCDTAELARLVQHVNGGAMLDWAVYRKGTLANWIRRSMEGLIAPYRQNAKGETVRAKPPRKRKAATS